MCNEGIFSTVYSLAIAGVLLDNAHMCCICTMTSFVIIYWACGNAYCPACRTSLIATRFWVVVICPIIKCLTVLEFSFILFELCLFITIFNCILNYVPIVTFWIFTYHKIWILNYLLFYMKLLNYLFFNMFGSVLECCELTGVSLLWPWLIKWKWGSLFKN